MNFVSKFLGKGYKRKGVKEEPTEVRGSKSTSHRYTIAEQIAMPRVAGRNFMKLFNTVPEVFFSIDFIASRIAKATFVVKRYKDDSVVWDRNPMLKILTKPNCLMAWSEFVYSHFVYKLATGNTFMRAAIAEVFADSKKYKMCSNFWVLPSDYVSVVPKSREIPLFSICEKDDLISCYRLSFGGKEINIPSYEIWQDRDGTPEFSPSGFLKSKSRLNSVLKPIGNLLAVYEARNIIYVKRGGLGFLINSKSDESGSVALTPKEMEELREEMNRYGIGEGQSPFGYSNVPLGFIRTNLSIADLQPFDETLEDAVKIAGAFGIPDVLVPRRDHSTFSNQATAEKSAYCGVIIPMAKQFCNDLTSFLGLDQDGYYLDCDFSDVDCLQDGMKEKEEVKKLINERCRRQFLDGIITLNDWRGQIHESHIDEKEDPIFSKIKFQMTDEELARIDKIIKNNNSNNKTSTGDEQQSGNETKSGLRDEDK